MIETLLVFIFLLEVNKNKDSNMMFYEIKQQFFKKHTIKRISTSAIFSFEKNLKTTLFFKERS